jgi:hypothetical protein
MKEFDISEDTVVVTSSEVTSGSYPVLYVTHEDDEEEGVIWQFHSGTGNYSPEILELVRLGSILDIAPEVRDVADLPIGWAAKRASAHDPWNYEQET